MTYVIDASAAVEVLLTTAVGRHVDELIADATLLAPELLDVEVLSVLRREVRARRLARARAEQALDDLAIWDIERIPHLSLLAAAWSFRDNLSAYDAMYAAAARLNGAPVLTVDGPLARAPLGDVVVHDVRVPGP